MKLFDKIQFFFIEHRNDERRKRKISILISVFQRYIESCTDPFDFDRQFFVFRRFVLLVVVTIQYLTSKFDRLYCWQRLSEMNRQKRFECFKFFNRNDANTKFSTNIKTEIIVKKFNWRTKKNQTKWKISFPSIYLCLELLNLENDPLLGELRSSFCQHKSMKTKAQINVWSTWFLIELNKLNHFWIEKKNNF